MQVEITLHTSGGQAIIFTQDNDPESDGMTMLSVSDTVSLTAEEAKTVSHLARNFARIAAEIIEQERAKE